MVQNTSSLPIPLVDFSAWTSENVSPVDRLAVARELVSACHTTGFVYIKNHGIAPELLSRVFAWDKKFHDLPQTQRLQVAVRENSFIGYTWPGREKASTLYENDTEDGLKVVEEDMALNEAFIITADDSQGGSNQWLPESVLPGFRADANQLYQDCWDLSAQLIRALALGLNLDSEHDLLTLHSIKNNNYLAFRHYPSIDAEKAQRAGLARLSAHRDFASITLLFQDNVGGLEVQRLDTKEGFVPVRPIDDTLVMNIGDALMRWTNVYNEENFLLHRESAHLKFSQTPNELTQKHTTDYLRSTTHRVNLPRVMDGAAEPEKMTTPRYSIPFFFAPKSDVSLECMPAFCGEANPPKYEPQSYQDYLMEMAAKLYKS